MKDTTLLKAREIMLSLSDDALSNALDLALSLEDWDAVWVIADELIIRRVDL